MLLASLAALTLSAAPVTSEVHHELSLSPTVQLNNKWSQVAGTDLRYTYWVRESVGVYGSWMENWYAAPAGWLDELSSKTRETNGPSTREIVRRSGYLGLVFAPVTGSLGDSRPFQLTFDVGMGLAERVFPTRFRTGEFVELVSLGTRVSGTAGLGFRIRINDYLAATSALRTSITHAAVDPRDTYQFCPPIYDAPPEAHPQCRALLDAFGSSEIIQPYTASVGLAVTL